jgi:peptidoglycan/LPS O-acetylase OafA/YrhL
MQIYFPGLNGIRAIAAFIVIFFHINSTMWFYGTTPIRYLEERDEMSRHAVVLFFVLSGYLITYLLIREKEKFGTIDVGKFYVRRILRIWPLFYAALGLALLILPFNSFHHSLSHNLKGIGLYALFIPNFALMAGYRLPTIAPLWSIGVEEQFYAVWPLFLRVIRNIFLFLLVFLFTCIAIKLALLLTGNIWSSFSINFNFFSYDTLAIGGIAAWLYAKKHKALKILYYPALQIISWLFFVTSLVAGPFDFDYIINKEVYALAFAIIILNVSTNPVALIRLEGKLFDFFGRISYGMYVLHPFIIVLTAVPLKYIIPGIPSKPLQFMVINAFVMPLTVLVAWLSFRYFESVFLKRKGHYSRVLSTNSKNEPETKSIRTEADALSL